MTVNQPNINLFVRWNLHLEFYACAVQQKFSFPMLKLISLHVLPGVVQLAFGVIKIASGGGLYRDGGTGSYSLGSADQGRRGAVCGAGA